MTPDTMTLTELLEGVDWSRMILRPTGEHRMVRDHHNRCPIDLCDGWSSDADTIDAVVGAADEYRNNPGQARWRHWMLEQIAAAKGKP